MADNVEIRRLALFIILVLAGLAFTSVNTPEFESSVFYTIILLVSLIILLNGDKVFGGLNKFFR